MTPSKHVSQVERHHSGGDFEIIDQNHQRHRFNGNKFRWEWRVTGEHMDIEDFTIVYVFRIDEEDGDILNASFPFPAKVGDVESGVCLNMPERQIERCPQCGFGRLESCPRPSESPASKLRPPDATCLPGSGSSFSRTSNSAAH